MGDCHFFTLVRQYNLDVGQHFVKSERLGSIRKSGECCATLYSGDMLGAHMIIFVGRQSD